MNIIQSFSENSTLYIFYTLLQKNDTKYAKLADLRIILSSHVKLAWEMISKLNKTASRNATVKRLFEKFNSLCVPLIIIIFFVLLLHNSDISREGKICSNAYFSSRYIISNMNKIPCIQMISLFDSSQFTFKLWAKKGKNNLVLVWVANQYILKFCFHLFGVLHSKANNWVSLNYTFVDICATIWVLIQNT